MREEFEKKLKRSETEPQLVVTKTTARESSKLTFWVFESGHLTATTMDDLSVREEADGTVTGILRCSNRWSSKCKFTARVRFTRQLQDFTEKNKLKSENWVIESIGNHSHAQIDPIGRVSLAKSKGALNCCNYSINCALKKVFNSHINKLAGKRENAVESAREMVLDGEKWTIDQVAGTFNMRNAKRSRRKI